MICDVLAHYLPRSFSDDMGDRFRPLVGKPTRTGLAYHPFSDLPEDISGRVRSRQVHSRPYLPDETRGVARDKDVERQLCRTSQKKPFF